MSLCSLVFDLNAVMHRIREADLEPPGSPVLDKATAIRSVLAARSDVNRTSETLQKIKTLYEPISVSKPISGVYLCLSCWDWV